MDGAGERAHSARGGYSEGIAELQEGMALVIQGDSRALRMGSAAVVLLMVAAFSGCSVIDRLSPSKREAQDHAQKLQDLQLGVMRFADEYVGRSNEAMNRFKEDTQNPEERLHVQTWKLQQATSAYTIATGPNPIANALDMVVLAALSRMVLDDVWVGQMDSTRAHQVQETARSLETGAWQLVSGTLNETQTTQLREVIAKWRAGHPNVRSVAYIHFRDFAKAVNPSLTGEESSSGLFSFIGIDPFSQLDPAVREIAQTRQLAERSIYYVQRAPELLDMQVERLTYQFAVLPETKTFLGDLGRASLIGSASDHLVKTLPAVLEKEREALVAQLVGVLNEESATVGKMAGELRETLQAGTETSNSIHAALETVERITGQFAPKPGSEDSGEKKPPFDIRQYTEMLKQATAATQELQALAGRADSILPALRSATEEAAGRGTQLLNHLFLLLALLILIAVTTTVLGALAYRRIVRSS
jgi:hypothetical protein